MREKRIILSPGTGEYGRVFVEVRLTVDGSKRRLSFVGVEGPEHNGDARGGCGQIHPVKVKEFAPGWTAPMVGKLNWAWDRWHLNDMRAGCEHQRKAKEKEVGTPCPTCGYKYGTAWLYEEVPQAVLDWLGKLPRVESSEYPWERF